jgi:hypothetical protein
MFLTTLSFLNLLAKISNISNKALPKTKAISPIEIADYKQHTGSLSLRLCVKILNDFHIR